MPELPEIETTRKGIAPYVVGEMIGDIIIRNRNLRWPVPTTLKRNIKGQPVWRLERRAKYLLFYIGNGYVIVHLGMSGSLHIVDSNSTIKKHDHVDIMFESGAILRFRDPRRFGAILWGKNDPLTHKLISSLGPEPLGDTFHTDYLFTKSRNRSQPIKSFIMNSQIVVGIGNIYANEVLFLSGLNPKKKAGQISKKCYETLVRNIRIILSNAIKKGNATLSSFVNGDSKPGYFKNELNVYDRAREACTSCKKPIKLIRIEQRSTYYCPNCQR